MLAPAHIHTVRLGRLSLPKPVRQSDPPADTLGMHVTRLSTGLSYRQDSANCHSVDLFATICQSLPISQQSTWPPVKMTVTICPSLAGMANRTGHLPSVLQSIGLTAFYVGTVVQIMQDDVA